MLCNGLIFGVCNEQLSEEHDTTTCNQQNLQFRFRNLRKPRVTDLRQERDVVIM
jgi:hypothetical protein